MIISEHVFVRKKGIDCHCPRNNIELFYMLSRLRRMPSSASGPRGGRIGTCGHALDTGTLCRRDGKDHRPTGAGRGGSSGVQAGQVRGQTHGHCPDVRVPGLCQIPTTVRAPRVFSHSKTYLCNNGLLRWKFYYTVLVIRCITFKIICNNLDKNRLLSVTVYYN